jgi:hypothetical protein
MWPLSVRLHMKHGWQTWILVFEYQVTEARINQTWGHWQIMIDKGRLAAGLGPWSLGPAAKPPSLFANRPLLFLTRPLLLLYLSFSLLFMPYCFSFVPECPWFVPYFKMRDDKTKQIMITCCLRDLLVNSLGPDGPSPCSNDNLAHESWPAGDWTLLVACLYGMFRHCFWFIEDAMRCGHRPHPNNLQMLHGIFACLFVVNPLHSLKFRQRSSPRWSSPWKSRLPQGLLKCLQRHSKQSLMESVHEVSFSSCG